MISYKGVTFNGFKKSVGRFSKTRMNYWYKKAMSTRIIFFADIRGGNLKWLNEQKEERNRRAMIDYIGAI